MTKKQINQNDSYKNELLNSIDNEYIYESAPISRIKNKIYNSEDKLKSLDELKNKISSIEDCKLKENASNLVFSDGSIDSQIMIIGEGPGQKEDELSKPFVGDAGMLLNKMLKAININRKDIYITNVVNYRPPNNRRPTQEEITRYLPYLKEHIEIINPKILVLLGSTALNALIGNEVVISKARGQWIEKQFGECKTSVIVTFHPAFLMRQPAQKKMAWIDLKMIRETKSKLRI